MALRTIRSILCSALLSFIIPAALGQDEPAAAEPANPEAEGSLSEPQAVTTADPDIPVDHLELLLQPLTVEELEVEA